MVADFDSRGTLPLGARTVRSIAVLGPYAGAAHTGGGSSHVLPMYKVHPVDGIRSRVGPGVPVRCAQGVSRGGPPPVPDAALNPPGRPEGARLARRVLPEPHVQRSPAGDPDRREGRVQFGEANPGGRLPITFPRRDGDVPASTPQQYPGVGGVARYPEGVFVGYRRYDARGIEPLFPFGHGLSYTGFRMRRLR